MIRVDIYMQASTYYYKLVGHPPDPRVRYVGHLQMIDPV